VALMMLKTDIIVRATNEELEQDYFMKWDRWQKPIFRGWGVGQW
jgi:hypothetical protein